jgi:hypothetical protein
VTEPGGSHSLQLEQLARTLAIGSEHAAKRPSSGSSTLQVAGGCQNARHCFGWFWWARKSGD